MKKIIALICVLALLFTNANALEIEFDIKIPNPVLSLPAAGIPYVTDGTADIQAEDCAISKNATIIDEETASGKMAVKFTPPASASTVEDAESVPTILAEFMVTETGSYAIWVRIKAETAGSDSVYWAANNDNYNVKYLTATPGWQWLCFTTLPLDEGKAFFGFKYREKNFIIDRFVVTTDTAFKPEGADDMPKTNSEQLGNVSQVRFPEAPVKPISGHPRVFLTPEYITRLKAYIKTDEIAPAWEAVVAMAEKDINSNLPSGIQGNYDADIVNSIMCKALLFALGEKNPSWATDTINHAKNVLSTVTFAQINDVTRQMGMVMTMGAVVYDWCYDYMSESDKKLFISRFKVICSMQEVGYPPQENIVATGSHMGEYGIHRDMLSCGIACYDEDKEMYELAAGVIYSRFLPSRKLYNLSSSHPAGSAYGPYRLSCELYAELLIQRMGFESIYGESAENVLKRYIYARRPDGLILKDGDDFTFSSRSKVTQYSFNDYQALIIMNALYDDPIVRGQFIKELATQGYTKDAFWLVVCADPGKEFEYNDELPHAMKTGYPLTSVIHRTSWQNGLNSPAAMAYFQGYERNIGDHMHLDSGSFQIYYKGALAIDSGNYQGKGGGWGSQHYFNYSKRTISHNLVTVYDPDELFQYYGKTYNSIPTPYANDGGQRMREVSTAQDYETMMSDDNHYADTLASYIGSNEITPAFSYLKTNLKPAYSDKVSAYTRSMVFMDLFDEDYPAAFVVFDNVTSSNKSFDKKWLLHSIEEPVVDGNTTTISRTQDGYDGKLVNKTLLPDKFEIKKVGGEGKEAYVNGVNYPNADSGSANSEQGSWRIELSPGNEAQNDIFLNAMYVTDCSKNLPELKMTKEESGNFVGVSIKDRLVLFAKNAQTNNSNVAITIKANGYNAVKCFIADMKVGVWNISGNGKSFNVESKEGENVLCFEAAPGSYLITPVSGIGNSITDAQEQKEKSGDFIIFNQATGCFVRNKLPNKLIDNIPYVPARHIFEEMGAKTEWDSSLGCAIVKKSGRQIMLYPRNSFYNMDGKNISLDGEIFVENGVMYVPFMGFKEFFKYKMNYDALARIFNVNITVVPKEIASLVDVENDVINPVSISASGNDGNLETGANDYSFDTRWSSQGDNEWLEYDLGKVQDISKVLMSFYNGHKRSTSFEILVSNDGISYTSVLSAKSSGTSDRPEMWTVNIRARYVRILCHGNNLNKWNSISELIISK